MFAFRVATRLGIGHLMRMKWLAKALIARHQNVIFFLDRCEEAVREKISDLSCAIHQIDIDIHGYSEVVDAQVCIDLLQKNQCSCLIVDSYWLGIAFEKQVTEQGFELIVFDDLEREHQCDKLFDQKWQGSDTQQRYQQKVPEYCQRLLGPKYCLLAPDYQQGEHRLTSEAKQQTILFSLGGGGDLSLIAELVEQLLASTSQSDVIYQVVIGPQAINTKSIQALASQESRLELLVNPQSLQSYYRCADLFVGALGTSLYELAACKTPALTFSIADNQHNDILDLQDLGHYFHINQFERKEISQFVRVIETLLANSSRVRALRENSAIELDGKGAERVADILLGESCTDDKEEVSNSMSFSMEKLSDNISIRPVNDSDINRYLIARNLPNNADRMTITQKIPSLNHYSWWFNNTRESFVMYDEGYESLYLWHDVFQYKNQDYLYGGWFTAGEDVKFNIAMIALKWQLAMTKQRFPNAIWLAVINKENKFVNLLNQYMGFVKIEFSDTKYKITKDIFPHASSEQFNYVCLSCKDIK